MKLYTVPGYDSPLLLSEDHADLIGGQEYLPSPADSAGRKPGTHGSKASWVAYAITQGMDAAEAEASTRTLLMDQYGT